MAIYRTASFMVREDRLDHCKGMIRKFVDEMREKEPGTRLYVSLQDQVTPNRFVHFYVFENEAAERAHNESELSRRFSEFLGPELAGPVSFGDFDLVAST